jgi:hypothetical protein
VYIFLLARETNVFTLGIRLNYSKGPSLSALRSQLLL